MIGLTRPKAKPHRLRPWLLGSLFALSCAGSGEGLDKNGRPVGVGGPNNPTSFSALQQDVFTSICTKCHIGAGAPQGLQLDEANAYLALVDRSSIEVPDFPRAKPYEPANSYIIIKISPSDPRRLGERMPRNGPYLDDDVIANIQEWIKRGAKEF
jgi:hypothetical protein